MRQTGDAVSALAGKYAKVTGIQIAAMPLSELNEFAAAVRSMAASLRSQDETPGRRGPIAQFLGRFGKPLER